MKKRLSAVLCAAALLVSMLVPVSAAGASARTERTVPAVKQGDFYLLVNGEFVTFPDAVPKSLNNRSFLPVRAAFDALGFDEVLWDNVTKTATANKGDLTIKLTLGESAFTVIENGVSRVVTTDAPNFADTETQRTYAPIGLIGRALDGYAAGWDNRNKVVIIDCIDDLLADYKETFNLYDQYQQSVDTYSRGNWNLTGDLDSTVTISGYMPAFENPSMNQAVDLTFTSTGSYSVLTGSSTALEMESDTITDCVFKINGTPADSLSQLEDFPSYPMEQNLKLMGDLSTGDMYYKSSGSTAANAPDPNTWYKVSLSTLWGSISSSMAMTYEQFTALTRLQPGAGLRSSLRSFLKSMPVDSINATTKDNLAMLTEMLADSSFKKTDSGYVNSLPGGGTITFNTKDGKISGLTMALHSESSSVDTAGMHTYSDINVSQIDGRVTLSMKSGIDTDPSGNALSIVMNMNMGGTYSESATAPKTKPASDEHVEEVTQAPGLLGGLAQPAA